MVPPPACRIAELSHRRVLGTGLVGRPTELCAVLARPVRAGRIVSARTGHTPRLRRSLVRMASFPEPRRRGLRRSLIADKSAAKLARLRVSASSRAARSTGHLGDRLSLRYACRPPVRRCPAAASRRSRSRACPPDVDVFCSTNPTRHRRRHQSRIYRLMGNRRLRGVLFVSSTFPS